ncbi:MAG: GNAT family N-acetyltransferase [bacterium]
MTADHLHITSPPAFRIEQIRNLNQLSSVKPLLLAEMQKRDKIIELIIPDHEREVDNIFHKSYGEIFCAFDKDKPAGALILRNLPVESSIYGMKIAMVRLLFTVREGTESKEIKKELLNHILLFSKTQGIRYILYAGGSPDTIETEPLQTTGFEHLAQMVNLRRQSGELTAAPPPSGVNIRSMGSGDISAIADIAAESFIHDRYNADPFLPSDKTREIHGEWARKCCNFCHHVFVAVKQNRPVGFSAVTLPDKFSPSPVIQLIAVAPAHQQNGIGKSLLQKSLRQCQPPAQVVLVRTEAKNLPAMNLYQSAGFKIYSSFYYFRKIV